MIFFQFLQTIIATVLIFLILSLIASEIIEAISNGVRMRAKTLKRTIEMLFGEELTERLYNEDGFLRRISLNITGPSYIKPTDFGKAVMMQLQKDKVSNSKSLVALIKEGTIPTENGRSKEFLKELARIIEHNQYPKEIEKDEDKKLKLEIENSFVSAQERATGNYKRQAQIGLFVLGLGIAFLANADTIHIISEFYKNPLQSQALVEAIDDVVGPEDSLENIAPAIETVFKDSSGELPIFWQEDKNGDGKFEFREGQSLGTAAFGWLLTAFAIMMGAPFWFDLLNKFFEFRSTLKPLDGSGADKKPEK